MNKKELTKLLSFMSTFDGGLYRKKNDRGYLLNAKYIMNMRKENLDYVQWVKEVLDHVTESKIDDRRDYNTDGFVRDEQVILESRCHPFLTTLHDRIYLDGRKVLDLHMLKLLDAEALSIIFMADGGTALDLRNKKPHCKITLNTKGFSEADNLALSKAIYDKLGIRSTVHRHNKYFYLYIKTADVKLFVTTVLPYIKPSFLYKFERIAPALNLLDDEIVWTNWKQLEVDRNSQPTQVIEE
jgi:hypothetical protein